MEKKRTSWLSKLYLILILIISTSCIGKNRFVLKYGSGGDKKRLMYFDISSGLKHDEVFWLQDAGLKCSFSAWADDSQALISCFSRDGYKVQTSVNCSFHSSELKSAYLFFSNTKLFSGNVNIYSWCE